LSPRRHAKFWQWVRHHTTSLFSTLVDYGTMVAGVEALHLAPVVATVIGATVGAITNFLVNRRFTYQAGDNVRRQVWRFVLVSAISLALNGLGEHIFHNVIGIQYVAARVITSVIVSNGWNYPLLRFFVFSGRAPEHR
jgi:putative flippase GtrA